MSNCPYRSMHRIILEGGGNFAEWRDAARAFAAAGVPPEAIEWREKEGSDELFGAEYDSSSPLPRDMRARMTVPPAFMELAEAVACHLDPGRFALLYRLLWRLMLDRQLLEIVSDEDVSRARLMEKGVRRDCHKMKAFVRFKEIGELPPSDTARRRFLAWFEPDHHILRRVAPFFQRRFSDMDWIIATPRGSVSWNGETLTINGAGCEKPDIIDATDDLWRTYYASIFNPARLKVKAMQSEMPKKYWKNLPEAALIPGLIATAETRVLAMADRGPSEPLRFHDRLRDAATNRRAATSIASQGTFEALRETAAACTRCPLFERATQTVFGEGPANADIMFVGEQPGDQEDLAGRPFVGPAGKLFDQALAEAGLDRKTVYVTNAVKHFKYEPRGKRRIHQRPSADEVTQCRWWLDHELKLLKPRLVVAMGATALSALTDMRHRLADFRGRVLPLSDDRLLFVTVHPAFLLRIPDGARKQQEMNFFLRDMIEVRKLAEVLPSIEIDGDAGGRG